MAGFWHRNAFDNGRETNIAPIGAARILPGRPSLIDLGVPGVRVRTIMTLRWIAVGGQLATLGIVAFYFHFLVHPLPIFIAVGALVLMNLLLGIGRRAGQFLSGRQATVQLGFDLLQLAAMLYLTGGLQNPFAVLLLAPVTISATLLSMRSTIALSLIAMATLTVLWLWALPLPWRGDLSLPPAYRFGVWVALNLTMAFLATYAWLVSAEARRRQQALIATQDALAREQKLAALGSLAAAAAHELGGPLGTITLIARDLRDQLGNDPDFGDDLALLDDEASRCRDILVGIARRAEAEEAFPSVSLESIAREVARPFEARGATIQISRAGAKGVRLVQAERRPELLHGLSNFVANAVRHASAAVRIDIRESRDEVSVIVSDDGAGFDASLLPRLGEPDLGPHRSGSGGTGLGVFIGTTLLERIGARLRFANGEEGGARVEISWPRAAIDVA